MNIEIYILIQILDKFLEIIFFTKIQIFLYFQFIKI